MRVGYSVTIGSVRPVHVGSSMTVKHSLLALLAEEPAHSYQLKSSFEARTGGVWMLNIGQVYTTLQRLERDGLVASDEDEDRTAYRLTSVGRQALEGWFATPIVEDPPPRDELTLKVLLAVGADDVDLAGILQRQRTAAVEHLQTLTRQKAAAHPDDDLPWLLLLDALVLRTEAELRWLDLCEARVSRARQDHTAPRAGEDDR